ncbi:hypothetical protein ACFO0N_15240 [Halobium salinum]|uniref:DUF8139 domain-containing protein n=1 Tax=Halobium salinum TaxID=1364940 RepID=A0ABD5PFL1_9EURY|nr:hypothetical protein [Halobium salinum]
MNRIAKGDRVRVDIPDEADPDHDLHHGRHGTVVKVIQDDASRTTGDDRDGALFRIKFDEGGTGDFRRRDLRPPLE